MILINQFDTCAVLREFLQQVVRHVDTLQQRGGVCGGLPASHNQILYELGKQEQLSLNELASIFQMDPSTLSRQVHSLVEMEMVNRVTNPYDRRAIILSLTPKGVSKRDEVTQKMCKHISQILKSIPDNKVVLVIEAIGLLSNAISNNSVV